MHVILTGATGLVGSGALAQVLASMKTGGPISRLSILSRSPVPMAEGQENVTVIQHKDFEKYPPEVLKQLEGAEACIWAQGISQTQVGKEWVGGMILHNRANGADARAENTSRSLRTTH